MFKIKQTITTLSSPQSNGRLYDNVFIPAEFENIILRHVILNCIKLPSFRPAPLLLLQGNKGEGKSFMTETVLKSNGIFYKFISSSILAGNKENDAVDNLMLYYNKCQMSAEQGKYSALVIDDFHLSIAITKSTASHTTNADNLLSALMNIADRKAELKAPIILIGNNFTSAYAPLTRLGRMNISTWRPSLFDKTEIIKRIILNYEHDDACTDSEELQKFVETYKDQYIGFFEQVIENIMFEGFEDVTDFFASRKGAVSYQELASTITKKIQKKHISIESLYREANELSARKLEKCDE